MVSIRYALFTLILFASGIADASNASMPLEKRLTPEQLRETGLDTLNAEQLAALNRILQATPEIGSNLIPARIEAATPKAAAPLLGFAVEPIRSRLKGTITGWQEGTVFELENGQQWKVLKGNMKLPKPMLNPEIRVVPGIAGRWFLEVHEDYPKSRVYLIN